MLTKMMCMLNMDKPIMRKMFYIKKVLLSLIVLTSIPVPSSQKNPQLGKYTAREVIAAMTVEEKVKILVGKHQ